MQLPILPTGLDLVIEGLAGRELENCYDRSYFSCRL